MRRLRPALLGLPTGLARRRNLAAASAAALALLLPTACGGSQVDPEVASAANQAARGATYAAGLGASVGNGETLPGAVDAPTEGDQAPGAPVGGSPGAPTGGGPSTANGTTPDPGAGRGVGIRAASCVGFKNQLGVTDSTITIGNASDVSGPIPGLFAAAQQATKAYVAYFNTRSAICGRKLVLRTYDSRTDAGAGQTAYTKACDEVFATVGSMSGFDSGGAQEAASCGLPDIRTASVTADRNNCSSCFGAQSTGPFEFPNAIGDFFVKNYRDATQKAAMVYLSAGAAAENAKTQVEVLTRRGMKFVYTSPIDVADFNYGPYVQQMKSKGVRWVQMIGAYQQTVRLAQAFKSANYRPEVFYADPSAYDRNYVTTGGDAVDGTITFTNFTPFEESQPELDLYKQWLQQISPGSVPTFFGLFAWSAAKLFTEEATKLGGKLNRASLVAKIRGVNNWTADGMHAPMPVGSKHVSACARFLELDKGNWRPLKAIRYTCNGLTKVK